MITPYASVTPSNSQVGILLDYYYNSDSFSLLKDYVICRTGENEYTLFVPRRDNSADVIRYSRSDVRNQWRITTGETPYTGVDTSVYTCVGSIDGTLCSPDYAEHCTSLLSSWLITFVVIVYMILSFFPKVGNK